MENKLINLRKNKRISQREMAEMLGLKPNTYNQYETGVRSIPAEIAKKISIILGGTEDEIFLPQKFTIRNV